MSACPTTPWPCGAACAWAHMLSPQKMEYHLDIIGQREVLIVAESPIGFRRWMMSMNWKSDSTSRMNSRRSVVGADQGTIQPARATLVVGRRPVPQHLLEKAQAAILPPTDPPKAPADLLAATRSLYDSTGTALMSQRWKQEGKA